MFSGHMTHRRGVLEAQPLMATLAGHPVTVLTTVLALSLGPFGRRDSGRDPRCSRGLEPLRGLWWALGL